MDRNTKVQIAAQVSEQLSVSEMVVLSDFKGITVEEVTELRNQIREQEGIFRVAKNTLTARAFSDDKYETFRGLLKGPSVLTFAKQDPVAVLKVLTEFEKKSGGKLTIKGGMLDDRFTTAEELKTISKLPPKEVLLGQVVGLIASPLTGFLNVCSGPIRKLAYAIKALEEKKAKEGADLPAS